MAALTGLHHVALSVKDLDASIAWYEDLFGFVEEFRDDNEERLMAVLSFPGASQHLGLVQHVAAGAPFDPVNIGLDHAAFVVASGEDLDAYAAVFEERGITSSGVLRTPFGGMINFKDPDGIAVSLFWDRSAAVGEGDLGAGA